MYSVPTPECRAAKRIARTAQRNLRCEGGNLHRARKCCAVKGGKPAPGVEVLRCEGGGPALGMEVPRCEGGNLHWAWKYCVVKGILLPQVKIGKQRVMEESGHKRRMMLQFPHE